MSAECDDHGSDLTVDGYCADCRVEVLERALAPFALVRRTLGVGGPIDGARFGTGIDLSVITAAGTPRTTSIAFEHFKRAEDLLGNAAQAVLAQEPFEPHPRRIAFQWPDPGAPPE